MSKPHDTPNRAMLALPAVHRLALACVAVVLLWLAVAWSVSLP